MNDPKRWSETNSGADSWEKQILRSELDSRAPSGASAVVWGKLAAELGLAGALVTLATPQASASVAKAGVAAQSLTTAPTWIAFAKGVCVGILLSTAAWSGLQLAKGSDEHAPKGDAPVFAQMRTEPVPSHPSAGPPSRPDPSLAPKAAPSLARPTFAPSVPVPPQKAPGTTLPAPTSASFEAAVEGGMNSALAEQARLLRLARAQLRNGELASAETTLREAHLRSSASMLSQEREALDIELLFRQGDHAPASRRAQAFLAAHPESPHAARVRSFVTP